MHLYLPRAVGGGGGRQAGADGRQPPEIGGRVLVVDDDAAVREITVQMLRQAGYGVVEAESGQAALDALGRGEIYDLVVIDVAMPGLSGIETIRRARERWPALRALYITGYADIAGAELQTGDDPMLKKPFRLTELTAAVRDAIKQPPPESAAGRRAAGQKADAVAAVAGAIWRELESKARVEDFSPPRQIGTMSGSGEMPC